MEGILEYMGGRNPERGTWSREDRENIKIDVDLVDAEDENDEDGAAGCEAAG